MDQGTSARNIKLGISSNDLTLFCFKNACGKVKTSLKVDSSSPRMHCQKTAKNGEKERENIQTHYSPNGAAVVNKHRKEGHQQSKGE